MARTISQLLRAVHTGRLSVRFGLGGGAGLEALEEELQRRSPWHPAALNRRAAQALPETLLGPPPAELRESALLFQQGQVDRALRAAHATSHPWSQVVQGDLSLLQGQPERALLAYERAEEDLGPLADLLARRGRATLEAGGALDAWDLSAEALVLNPLLGTGRQLLEDAASHAGVATVRLPLRAPVRRSRGKLEALHRLSPRASAAWSAWNRAASSPEAAQLPPGSVPHVALLRAWRQHEARAARYGEHDDREILNLLRWQEQGVIGAYEWSAGLGPGNAEAYRAERRRAGETLRRFWREGVRA